MLCFHWINILFHLFHSTHFSIHVASHVWPDTEMNSPPWWRHQMETFWRIFVNTKSCHYSPFPVLYMVSRNIESLLHPISIATGITNRYHVLDIDSNDWLTRWGQKLINLHHGHQMETFSALLALCAGNSPVTGEYPSQRPVTRSFDVFLDLHLNKRFE